MVRLPAWGLIFILGLLSEVAFGGSEFSQENSIHLKFADLRANSFAWSKDSLAINVTQSASALVVPMKRVRTAKEISFEWKATGKIAWVNPEQQKRKEGDDALLRVSLLRHGKPSGIPMFLPGWIKLLKKILHHPANRIVSLIVGSPLPAGETWESPYGSSITNIAVTSRVAKDGWMKARQSFQDGIPISGYWVMADGDNLGASFAVSIRNLQWVFAEAR